MRLKIPIKEIPQRLGRIYIFQVVLIFHHQNFDFPPSVPAEKRSQIKSAEGENREQKYVCFLVIVEVRVSHLSYAFFSNWYVCTYSIMFSKNLYLERTRRFFWKKNNTKRSPSNPHQKWKLFSFEIVLRGRMVLCKIHAAIYTIAAAASAPQPLFWKMQ